MSEKIYQTTKEPKRVLHLSVYENRIAQTGDIEISGYRGSCPICKTRNCVESPVEVSNCHNCGQPLDWTDNTVKIVYDKLNDDEYSKGIKKYNLINAMTVIASIIVFIIGISILDKILSSVVFVLAWSFGMLMAGIAIVGIASKYKNKIPTRILYTKILKKHRNRKIISVNYNQKQQELIIEFAPEGKKSKNTVSIDLYYMKQKWDNNISETIIDFTNNEIIQRSVGVHTVTVEKQLCKNFENPYSN